MTRAANVRPPQLTNHEHHGKENERDEEAFEPDPKATAKPPSLVKDQRTLQVLQAHDEAQDSTLSRAVDPVFWTTAPDSVCVFGYTERVNQVKSLPKTLVGSRHGPIRKKPP